MFFLLFVFLFIMPAFYCYDICESIWTWIEYLMVLGFYSYEEYCHMYNICLELLSFKLQYVEARRAEEITSSYPSRIQFRLGAKPSPPLPSVLHQIVYRTSSSRRIFQEGKLPALLFGEDLAHQLSTCTRTHPDHFHPPPWLSVHDLIVWTPLHTSYHLQIYRPKRRSTACVEVYLYPYGRPKFSQKSIFNFPYLMIWHCICI